MTPEQQAGISERRHRRYPRRITAWVSEEQYQKFLRLGGPETLRRMLDNTHLPEAGS